MFTPTGEATWDVSFSFQFQGSHTFSGTAEGSLKNGKLEGTVLNERETRSFDFRGTVKQLPSREEITMPIQEQLIVELYSK